MMASLGLPVAGIAWLALLTFWLIGASSRLARRRAAIGEAFSAWDRLQSDKLERIADRAGDLSPDRAARARLDAAAEQLRLSLAAARSRPYDGRVIASLGLARQILQAVWLRVRREASLPRIDEGGMAALDEWDRLLLQEQPLVAAFNDAVGAYNAAVGQFPAVLVAWLFRFRPALTLVSLEEQA